MQTTTAAAETVAGETTETPCPVCSGAARFGFAKMGYEIWRCSACDFLFVHPYPTAEQLSAHYNTNYRKASADYYPKAMKRRQRSLQRAFLLWPHLRGRSVLEVGCGGGFMSWAMSYFAKETTGVDLSQGAIDYARAHFPRSTFFNGDLKSVAQMGKTYDLVFSSELLEHLPGVEAFMAAMVATTHSGSLVYVSAPDASHKQTPADIETWGDVCPPEHLQWFGRANLAALFTRYGFEPYRYLYAPKAAHNAIFKRV